MVEIQILTNIHTNVLFKLKCSDTKVTGYNRLLLLDTMWVSIFLVSSFINFSKHKEKNHSCQLQMTLTAQNLINKNRNEP